MYAREFYLIDKVVAVLKPKLYDLIEQRVSGIHGGAKDLKPMLESELCLQLTAEVTVDSDHECLAGKIAAPAAKILRLLT